MEFFSKLLFFITISTQCSHIFGAVFSVSTYGAYPNDNADDTAAVQTAIQKAIEAGPNNMVVFQGGTYNFKSAVGVYSARKLTITGQGMQQTFLIGSQPAAMFQPINCQELTITDLSIDFDPLPFTAGYVVSVSNNYLDVQVVAPHRADVGRQVHAILRYDPAMKRPAFGPKAYEIYQDPPENVYTSVISNGVVRLPLRNPANFAVGDAIVARYSHNRHAIDAQDVTDFTVRSVTIYTAWHMGLVALRARRLNINNYNVKPRDGRWMSTPVDCIHLSDSREYINVFDSKCEAQGDDGLNVHAFYFKVTQILSSNSLVIQEYNWPDVLSVGAGTRLEFSGSQQPFTVYTTATVASTSSHSADSRVFVFTGSVSVNVGDWVSVADTPKLTIRNFTVANNRARGVLIKTRHVHITNSLFLGTSGPAILFEPSMYWHESVAAQDVKLLDNVYINCNEGIAKQKGIISFAPNPRQLNRIFYDIVIQSSTFLFGPYSEGLLEGTNAANVYIRGNYISTNNSVPMVSVCNSLNICAHDNTFVNAKFPIQPYYYDKTSPCREDLSDFIGLVPSGFDARFPPPVMATKSGVQPYTSSFNMMDLSNIVSISSMIG